MGLNVTPCWLKYSILEVLQNSKVNMKESRLMENMKEKITRFLYIGTKDDLHMLLACWSDNTIAWYFDAKGQYKDWSSWHSSSSYLSLCIFIYYDDWILFSFLKLFHNWEISRELTQGCTYFNNLIEKDGEKYLLKHICTHI